MPKNDSKKEKYKSDSVIKKIILISLISAGIYFLLILMFTFICLKTNVSDELYLPLCIVCSAISGFITGLRISLFTKEKGALYGLVTSFVSSLIVSFVIFILNKGVIGISILILIGIYSLFGALGGITAVNVKRKIKY